MALPNLLPFRDIEKDDLAAPVRGHLSSLRTLQPAHRGNRARQVLSLERQRLYGDGRRRRTPRRLCGFLTRPEQQAAEQQEQRNGRTPGQGKEDGVKMSVTDIHK